MKAASGRRAWLAGRVRAQPASAASLASSTSRTRPCASASSSRSAAISSRSRLLSSSARSEPDADRFVACALTHREPRRCPVVAALPLDVRAQAGVAVEELAADARLLGDDRERDRRAFALEFDQRAAGALCGAGRAGGCRRAQDGGALSGHAPSPWRCWDARVISTTSSGVTAGSGSGVSASISARPKVSPGARAHTPANSASTASVKRFALGPPGRPAG